MSGNSGSTSTAAACDLRARPAYLGLATKVISEGPASSIPFTPVTSSSGSPRSSAFSRLANSPSFIETIVTEGPGAGGRGWLRRLRIVGEQFRLFLRLGTRFRPFPGWPANESHNLQGLDRLAGQIDTLGIGAHVGRGQQQAGALDQGTIIGRQSFQFLAVGEGQPQPQAGGARTNRKPLVKQAFRVGLVAGRRR